MLAFLPSPILFILNMTIISLSTILCSLPIMFFALIRIILPFKVVIHFISYINQICYDIWVYTNAFILKLTNKVIWDIEGISIPKVKGSCMIISNHISWLDIIILCHTFRGKIPVTKYFLKQNLIYIPFLGLACVGLGMPFLKRYSKAKLLKNPKLKNKDFETTIKACKRLIDERSTLVNFCEGTRFTVEKAKKANSKYENLMPPRAGSFALALSEIGNQLDCIFNVTLAYPQNPKKAMIAMLCGRLKQVYTRVDYLERDSSLIGDYLKDKEFKRNFVNRLREIWDEKDAILNRYLKKDKSDATIKQDNLDDK